MIRPQKPQEQLLKKEVSLVKPSPQPSRMSSPHSINSSAMLQALSLSNKPEVMVQSPPELRKREQKEQKKEEEEEKKRSGPLKEVHQAPTKQHQTPPSIIKNGRHRDGR